MDFSKVDKNILNAALDAALDVELSHAVCLDMIKKSQGLPMDADPGHSYSHRSGTYGDHEYYNTDPSGNYWKYTNAPEDHHHHDPVKGAPMIDPNQPMPHTAPEFFTPEGKKRHAAVPAGAETTRNEAYDPSDDKNLWYEKYQDQSGQDQYGYLDSDVRTHHDLHLQHHVRLVDSNIVKYRHFAAQAFQKTHDKDRVVGVVLMLVDQAFFDIRHLLTSTVEDLEFIGTTVKLQGRKIVVDGPLYSFFTALRAGREATEPLFALTTAHGKVPLGEYYISHVFKLLGVSPHFVLMWHASQMYSKIFHRIFDEGSIPMESVEDAAMDELANYLHTDLDVDHLVDQGVIRSLSSNISKGLAHSDTDDFGIPYVRSDLVQRTEDEMEFSQWLHSQPMHDDSGPEPDAVEQGVSEDLTAAEEPIERSLSVFYVNNVGTGVSKDFDAAYVSKSLVADAHTHFKSNETPTILMTDKTLTLSHTSSIVSAVQSVKAVLSDDTLGKSLCVMVDNPALYSAIVSELSGVSLSVGAAGQVIKFALDPSGNVTTLLGMGAV